MEVLVASEISSITVRVALARSTLSHYYYYFGFEISYENEKNI